MTPVLLPKPAVTSSGELLRFDFLYSNAIALTANQRTTLEIKTMQDCIFVVQTLMAKSTGRFQSRFLEDGSGNNWQNTLITDTLVFGTAQLPNVLMTPVPLYSSSSVVLDILDTSGAPNAVEVVLGGYKLAGEQGRPGGSGRIDIWYQYAVSKAVLASNEDTMNLKLMADSWFEVKKASARATGNFEARISDGLGKAWSDRYIQQDNQFGNAQYPRVLPMPKLLRPNSNILVEVRDLSAAPNTIEVVFEGVKRFSIPS